MYIYDDGRSDESETEELVDKRGSVTTYES